MSAYVDEAFQRITQKPCQDCFYFLPHKNKDFGLARCLHRQSIEPLTGLHQFAGAMRDSSGPCGLKGRLYVKV